MTDWQADDGGKWPIAVGIFVLLGSLATVACAFGKSWWG
jgi:hypothetical protein